MRLDGFGLLVNDMGTMIRFYRDVLGFEIKENEDDQSDRSVKISCTVIRTFRLMLLCITALASTGVWFLYTGLVQR